MKKTLTYKGRVSSPVGTLLGPDTSGAVWMIESVTYIDDIDASQVVVARQLEAL